MQVRWDEDRKKPGVLHSLMYHLHLKRLYAVLSRSQFKINKFDRDW